MPEAWLYATKEESALDIGAALAELGYRPSYRGSNHSGVTPPGGTSAVRPDLAVVVTDAGEQPQLRLLRQLRASRQLREAAVLLTLDPEHLLPSADLALAHELLVKPFTNQELRARVHRATGHLREHSGDDVVRDGPLELNVTSRRASLGRRPIELRRMEFELLEFLMTHPHRVLSREAILSSVWGYDYFGGARTVDVHVRRVRLKLGEYAERIKTVRSVGYLFEPAEPPGHVA
jgi:DNA-binding response OmpR family regulator